MYYRLAMPLVDFVLELMYFQKALLFVFALKLISLSLFFRKNFIIKTQHGYTRQIHIKDSIRQGGILSVLEYANLMDEITKEIRKNPKCNINIGNETTPGCFLWMDDVVLMHTDPRMIQIMLDTTYRISQRYRIKFGTEKSKVLHIGPPTPLRNKFTLGLQTLEATDTYKYLGITLNTTMT